MRGITDFRRFYISNAVAQVGAEVGLIAMPLIAVVALQANAFETGLLSAAGVSAYMLLGLPAGAWVDGMRRRRVIIGADLIRAFVLLAIPLVWFIGSLEIWLLCVAAFIINACRVFSDLARQSYLPHLVPADQLTSANASLEVVRTATQLVGPNLGGALVLIFTAPYAIVANGLGFLASTAMLGTIGKAEPQPIATRRGLPGVARDVRDGVKFVMGNGLLVRLMASTSIFNTFWSMVIAIQAYFLVHHLRLNAFAMGVFVAIGALGGIVGAAGTKRVVRWLGEGPAIWISLAFASPWFFVLAAVRPGWTTWLAAVGTAFMTAGLSVYNVVQLSFRQRITPGAMLGRMTATIRFSASTAMTVGALLGGALAEWLGVRGAIVVAAAGCCVSALPVMLSDFRRMRQLPTLAEQSGAANGSGAAASNAVAKS